VFQQEPESLGASQPSIIEGYTECSGHARPHIDEIFIYGVVFYRDMFGRHRHTTFGYQVTPNRDLERISGLPEYNNNA
jgi:hypothetical protein